MQELIVVMYRIDRLFNFSFCKKRGGNVNLSPPLVAIVLYFLCLALPAVHIQEFELAQSWGLTETMLSEATFNAARGSFLGDRDKKDLLKELRKAYGMEDKVELEIFINHKCGQPDDPRKVLKTSF